MMRYSLFCRSSLYPFGGVRQLFIESENSRSRDGSRKGGQEMNANVDNAEGLDFLGETTQADALGKIERAYDSEPWWYDIRGFFVLTFAYRCSLTSIIRFFNRNISNNHLEGAIGSGTMFDMILRWRAFRRQRTGRIVGFDYAEPMLAGARKRFAGRSGLRLIHADVARLPFENDMFDSANVANAVHSFPDVDAAFTELHRVLKPGARLAMNVLLHPTGPAILRKIANRINDWGMKKGILETPYERADIEARIRKAGFDVVEAIEAGNTLNVVARKPFAGKTEGRGIESSSKEERGDQAAMFSYDEAFSRNIGWVTPDEQQSLRGKRVAIAGMGGVGGLHLVTLARLGVGAFNLADFDTFSLVNFNRQVGATMSTLDQPKLEVMARTVRDINPDVKLGLFSNGISKDNMDEFFKDVDVFIDGLDYFAFEIRELAYRRCSELGIPAITVGPIGIGAAMLNFLPGRMTFEQYFRLAGQTKEEKALRFLAGLTPAALQRTYLADPSRVRLGSGAGPSMPMACMICAGVAATEALKLMLNRGKVLAAPHAMQFDAYRNKVVRTWRPGGNRNPLQRLLMAFIRYRLCAAAPRSAGPVTGQQPEPVAT
ncbi:MAG: hypothetical protein C0404_01275 [Verrucomicrobia bacterium]|nr:hypothetical protein [Verrucomicrobiota bacterium]